MIKLMVGIVTEYHASGEGLIKQLSIIGETKLYTPNNIPTYNIVFSTSGHNKY
jgi:hypothetical protein